MGNNQMTKKEPNRDRVSEMPLRRKSGTMGAWGRMLGLLLLLSLAVPAVAAGPQQFKDDNQSIAATKRISSDLRKFGAANPRGLVTVIVQFKSAPDSATIAGMRANGRILQRQFSAIRAVTMRLPASMLEQLANDPRISYITPDRQVKLTADEDYTEAVESDLAAAQFAMDGTSVGVAVIDSGSRDHLDLHNASGASRVVYSESFVPLDCYDSRCLRTRNACGRTDRRQRCQLQLGQGLSSAVFGHGAWE